MSGGRERILGRIREALDDRPVDPHPGRMPREAPDAAVSAEARAEVFAEAFERAGGEAVVLPDAAAAAAWLADFAAGFASVAVGEGVPRELAPDLPEAEPATAALGVSRAVAAAADTGSLLLESGGGRRAQLLPPVHLVWLEAADVRDTLDDALAEAEGRGLPPVLALHSGPSKSADIGRIVVTGVHGPGRVVAAIVGVAS